MDEDQERRHAQAERLRHGYRRTGRRNVVIGFVALLLVLGGVGAFAAYQVGKDRGPDAPENTTSDFGFTLSARDLDPKADKPIKPVVVQLWDDYFCEECRTFSEDVRTYLRQAVRRGDIELTYHPFPVTRDTSTNNYGIRAANAAACVGDVAGVKAYASMHDLLMRRQPKSGKPGASTAKLVAWAVSAGAKEKDVEDCIRDQEFIDWLEEAEVVGKEGEVTEAPTIRVDGNRIVSPGKGGAEVMPDRKELEFAIDGAAN